MAQAGADPQAARPAAPAVAPSHRVCAAGGAAVPIPATADAADRVLAEGGHPHLHRPGAAGRVERLRPGRRPAAPGGRVLLRWRRRVFVLTPLAETARGWGWVIYFLNNTPGFPDSDQGASMFPLLPWAGYALLGGALGRPRDRRPARALGRWRPSRSWRLSGRRSPMPGRPSTASTPRARPTRWPTPASASSASAPRRSSSSAWRHEMWPPGGRIMPARQKRRRRGCF